MILLSEVAGHLSSQCLCPMLNGACWIARDFCLPHPLLFNYAAYISVQTRRAHMNEINSFHVGFTVNDAPDNATPAIMS